MNKSVIIIGAGGHARVIAEIIIKSGDTVIGFLDDNLDIQGKSVFKDIKVLGKISECESFQKKHKECLFIVGIGNNYVRAEIFNKYKLNYYIAIHPSSIISDGVKIGIGTVIMPNTVINVGSVIGSDCIINTGAIIEHDNVIKDNVHISPAATLCGTVEVGEFTHVGAGATIKNNIKIFKECTIGAGAVVVKDIEKSGTYAGVPVRIVEKEK